MSNSRSLGIAGLILGVIGICLGGYVFLDNTILNPQVPPPNITNYFFDEDYISFSNSDPQQLDLSSSINIPNNAEVYVMFNCEVTMGDDLIEFQITIDGVGVTRTMWISGPDGAIGGTTHEAVALQYYNGSYKGGAHVIDVWVDPDSAAIVLYAVSLFIQIIN